VEAFLQDIKLFKFLSAASSVFKMQKGKRGRRGNFGRRRLGYNGNQGDKIRLRGHHLTVFSTDPDPSGAARFSFHPNPGGIGGTRFVDLNVIYSQYRWIDMKFTFLASGSDAEPSAPIGAVVLGVMPNSALPSVPVSSRDIMELDHATLSFEDQSIPAVLKVPPSLLHGEKDYYETNVLPAVDAPCVGLISSIDTIGQGVGGKVMVRVDWEIEYYGRKPGNIVLGQSWSDYEQVPAPSLPTSAVERINGRADVNALHVASHASGLQSSWASNGRK
jgi:hypothetical protein